MGLPASEVGYTSATTGRGEHEVRKGHVVTLERKKISLKKSNLRTPQNIISAQQMVSHKKKAVKSKDSGMYLLAKFFPLKIAF
jgi:hypothetical protein